MNLFVETFEKRDVIMMDKAFISLKNELSSMVLTRWKKQQIKTKRDGKNRKTTKYQIKEVRNKEIKLFQHFFFNFQE
jgi:hypothetical protein